MVVDHEPLLRVVCMVRTHTPSVIAVVCGAASLRRPYFHRIHDGGGGTVPQRRKAAKMWNFRYEFIGTEDFGWVISELLNVVYYHEILFDLKIYIHSFKNNSYIQLFLLP